MISVMNVHMFYAVLILIVLFGIGSHFVFKFDEMEIKSIGLKIVKAIVCTVTIVIGFALVLMVKTNSAEFLELLHK